MNESTNITVGNAVFEILSAITDAKLETRLKKLAESYSYAGDIFEYLAYNERSFGAHSAERISKITRVDYYDTIKVLKVLDEMGVGSFTVGRKGHDTRMIWDFDSRSIGKVGLGKIFSLKPLSPDDVLEYHGLQPHEQTKKHEFFLRPDFAVKIELPADFNNEDALKMKAWLDFMTF